MVLVVIDKQQKYQDYLSFLFLSKILGNIGKSVHLAGKSARRGG